MFHQIYEPTKLKYIISQTANRSPSPKYEELKISVKRDTLKSARVSGVGARFESKLGVLSTDCYAGTTLAT